ncbi:hypothetical protein UlMin_040884 [Ulmus minor]
MAEQIEQAFSANSDQKPKEQALCEECKSNPSKYKCPGCSIRSCSLPCVKSHKQRTGCTGKKSHTHFVPISQFDDNQLISDYNLLEEVKRVAESAQRMRNKLCRYNNFKLPFNLRSLRNAASSRRTKLLFHPSGMSKREKNQSRYDHRKRIINWTIEWRFHSTDIILVDHGIDENMNICSIIKNHLKPGPWNHQLKQFCDVELDSLKFFIRQYPKGSKSPSYELDSKAPLRQQLANVVLLEYPVIYVVLPSQSINFEVIKNASVVRKPEHRSSGSNDHLSPKGVTFKEEEIEEDGPSPAPRVFDLMKLENPAQRASSAGVAAGNGLQSSSNTDELGRFDDMEFDFDQGLIDAYSDLISEINPDDFLDLEGLFAKEEEVEERRNILISGEDFLADDDLEEGEIKE